MLVKKVAGIFLFKLKLFKLVKLLTLPLIVLSFMLPFTDWNLNHAKQKYQFQQPSLKTKIFDLNYQKTQLQDEIRYQQLNQAIKMVFFPGKLINECILLTFPNSFSQSDTIKILHSTLRKDKNLSKNIVLLSYQNEKALRNMFEEHERRITSLKFGRIRIALNLNSEVRRRQKQTKRELKVFLQIYGKEGIRSDVDHYQSLKELLQRLQIPSSPCEEIHENHYLKLIRKIILNAKQSLGGSKAQIATFLDYLTCQANTSLFRTDRKAHSIMMQYGFQSSSLRFLVDQGEKDQTYLQYQQKMAKLAYSFVKQYSLQEDHLHSSATYFYPANNHYFLSVKGTLYPGLILLLVGVVNLVGFLVQNSYKVHSVTTIFNIVEIIIISFQYKFYADLSFTLSYLCTKFIAKAVLSLFYHSQDSVRSKQSVEQLCLAGLQLLICLYLSIFNFSLFYLGSFMSVLMLAKSNKTIVIISFVLLWLVCLYPETVVFQGVFKKLNPQNIITLIGQFFGFIKSLSLEVQIIFLPFLYGLGTFLY